MMDDFARQPLLWHPDGRVRLHLGDGALPRLVAYTHEDKAAKGLRKLAADATPLNPIPFTVLERLADTGFLLATAPAGGGKTVLARDLALRFVRAEAGGAAAGITAPAEIDRNDQGDALPERWPHDLPTPRLVTATADDTGPTLAARAALPSAGPALLIIDDLDAATNAPALLAALAARRADRPDLRILALAGTDTATTWPLPSGVARHALLPLPLAARRRALGAAAPPAAFSDLAADPSLFALATATTGDAATPEALIDAWLAARDDATALAAAALAGEPLPAIADPAPVRALIAAAALTAKPPRAAAAAFAGNPRRFAPVVASLARRLAAFKLPLDDLAAPLLDLDGPERQPAALIAATFVAPGSPHRDAIAAACLDIVTEAALSAREREAAGRILAAWGDPRHLDALVDVPGGRFAMGAATHPNSAPPHEVAVGPFRIGRYPVTNGQYARFAAAAGRVWRSPDKDRPERRNAPATDLTWHDANAYCAWLTGEWRRAGRIAANERVRLPTEPEWERAARGDQPDGGGAEVYPWAGAWTPGAVNGEETGFNDTCTVGLFPAGASPYGCLDMAGQVWEWCSTLWGDDMAAPSFRYPYAEDGREAADAGPAIRRVLRGGCFSSGAPKATCTYRGSLEPDGFWRGNGFRIVVAADRHPVNDRPGGIPHASR
jgi:iron(II)-dependent oxidoreductase